MKYPILKQLPVSRQIIDEFKGYNHNFRIGSGEFYDMKNLTSDNYPILSPRVKRGVYEANATSPKGMIAKDKFCYVDGDYFVIDGEKTLIKGGLTSEYDSEGKTKPKTLISMGAYVIIMPDKKYINTQDPNDNGSIEAKVTTSSDVVFSISKIDGVGYENTNPGAEPPQNPTSGMLWLDTSEVPNSLKVYSESEKKWSAIATTYIKIESEGIGQGFQTYDAVTISGIEDESLASLNASTTIWARGDDFIVVTGVVDKVITQKTPITVERRMPEMDFVIESDNRLWGCRYGMQNGVMVNEIYASKLGDFKNWNSFMGISTDSYAASLGTDGHFTGAITHLGYPLFFKENYVHKVYGNYPANYQIQSTACRGVQTGCERSLAIVNEVLFYKARSGVCSYDGSLPFEMSGALGDKTYGVATAGTLGNKYYISMRDEDDLYHLFVYDTKRGMWHREDATEASLFCNFHGNLYYIDRQDKQIKVVRGTGKGDVLEPSVKWEAISGIMGTESPDKKYVSRIDVRMRLDIGTRVVFFAEYDSSGTWEHLFTMTGRTLQSFSVPIRPQRCDHLRLKIEGDGDAKIFSICKTVEDGSDI